MSGYLNDYSAGHRSHRSTHALNRHANREASSYTRPPHHHSSTEPQRRSGIRWPPSPFAEDEHVSLQREARSNDAIPLDDIPERGLVDQDPIIIDVPQPKPDENASMSVFPTPSPTQLEKPPIKRGAHGPKLDTSLLPEMRRVPSPYSITMQSQPVGIKIKSNVVTPPASASGADTPSSSFESGSNIYRAYDPSYKHTASPAVSTYSSHIPAPPALRSARPLLSHDSRRHTDSWPDTLPKQQVDITRSSNTRSYPYRGTSSEHPLSTSPQNLLTRFPPSPPSSSRTSFDSDGRGAPALKSEHALLDETKFHAYLGQSNSRTARNISVDISSLNSCQRRPVSICSDGHRDMASGKPLSINQSPILPYPINHSPIAMPEERDHQFLPERKPMKPSPMIAHTLSKTEASSPVSSARPSLPKMHSLAECTPFSTPSQAAPSFGASLATAESALPPCPRADFKSGRADWFTLEGCPDLHICPCCLEQVFCPTYYAHFLTPHRGQAQSADARIRCDFAKPWLRLAWLLTLQRQLPSLKLLKDVHHHLDKSPPCPDAVPEQRVWMTVLDDVTRRPLRGFHICATDIGVIEILLPLLRGYWVPYPRRESTLSHHGLDPTPRLCSLRSTNNNRYAVFLDQLISLHENALQFSPGKIPEMTPFVKLIKRKLDMDECPRDNVVQNAKWYFIPMLPEFAVCEDCHDEIIAPLLRSNKDLAMRFNPTLQYLPSKARPPRSSGSSFKEPVGASSCSLYSARMRKHFARAVADNDLKYLAQKAKDRKTVERQLQGEAQPILARLQEIEELLKTYNKRSESRSYIHRLEDEQHRLAKALKRCRDKWAEWE